ncbi:hypothetical protein BHE74_00050855, partial [Ensete ventricosum]
MPRPTTPSIAIRAPALRKLTRDELREHSAKRLCWHYNESWSREHRCKKGQLLVIELVEDEDSEPSKEGLKPKEEAMEEEPQPGRLRSTRIGRLLQPADDEKVKARQPYTLMAAISFARIQEEQLNHKVRRTRVAPRPAMPRPIAPSTAIQAPAPKKLTRDELRERSTKELCWHYNEPRSHEHHCKKGWLLVIEPVEDKDNETSEKALEPIEEAMEEESPPANYAVYALAGYSNSQMMKVGGLLKQQPITVLIDTGNTNNFLNSKVAICLALQIK